MKLVDAMANGFQNELKKIAANKLAFFGKKAPPVAKTPGLAKILSSKYVLAPALGIAGWEMAKKTHRDWKTGRQIRRASGGRF
jgi:hypothetical protein